MMIYCLGVLKNYQVYNIFILPFCCINVLIYMFFERLSLVLLSKFVPRSLQVKLPNGGIIREHIVHETVVVIPWDEVGENSEILSKLDTKEHLFITIFIFLSLPQFLFSISKLSGVWNFEHGAHFQSTRKG